MPSSPPTARMLARIAASLPFAVAVAVAVAGCAMAVVPGPADLILTNGRVYTFTWGEPGRDGAPASDAPHGPAGWQPDATAIALERGSIVYIGDAAGAERYAGEHTRVVDLAGATLVPGLVDAHTHVFELGGNLEQVDLLGVVDEAEAVRRVAERVSIAPPGSWILGYGWDEGEWADRYPDNEMLSEAAPEHPVMLRGLHGFAVWGNRLALETAGITAATEAPAGGRIVRDGSGAPTGILLDRATTLLSEAVPAPSVAELETRLATGLQEMAAGGFTMVHEAGVDALQLQALENLAADGELPLRVYAMLSARDEPLLRQWMEWGPDVDGNDHLITRSVKAYFDGALGSRGARLLEDYTDLAGHRGVSGAAYGFDQDLVAEMMAAGFQANIHAIGDAANRETLDFLAAAAAGATLPERTEGTPDPLVTADLRLRVEHAQVVHPRDFWRFRQLGVIASVQPPHAVEDKTWAGQRLGPVRIAGAYAWRTFRLINVPLVLSSDLPGSDHDVFYGLHAAVTRRDRQLDPPDGWYPDQRLTVEEALRGYTGWAARAAFVDDKAGRLIPGLWADLTVIDLDPLAVGETDADRLLQGRILMTIVGGRVVYEVER